METTQTPGPRERLADAGPRGLTDAELLALLLGTGTRGRGAVSIATGVLERTGGLRGIAAAGHGELRDLPGVGPVRALQIRALAELASRLAATPLSRGDRIASAEQVFRALGPRLRDEAREVFLAVPLDARHRLVAAPRVIAVGHLTGVDVHPREVFRPLIRESAARFVVVHNHPSSGDPEPSPQDLALTERLRQAGALVGIPLVDHVILGETGWVSLRDRGILPASL